MILAVEDDPWIRLFQIILDPATPPERIAAFAHFVAHDLPDFSGWLERLRTDIGALYPSQVRLIKDERDFAGGLAGAAVAAVESFAVGEKEIAAAGGALKIVQKYGGVTTSIDRAACERAGVRVLVQKRRANAATAEHAFALLLSLNRKVHLAYERIRHGNFCLDGLLGFDLSGKTFGLVGVGNIGSVAARIATGFGCKVLGTDPVQREDCRGIVEYVPLDELLELSDVVSLHCPLNESTRHLIGARELARMKPTSLLINTSRGAVIDTPAVLNALEGSSLGGLAIDVYEREGGLFFEDHSGEELNDKQFERLLDFPNVLVTPHQGFFTAEALANIASTTIENIEAFQRTGQPLHPVDVEGAGAQRVRSPSNGTDPLLRSVKINATPESTTARVG